MAIPNRKSKIGISGSSLRLVGAVSIVVVLFILFSALSGCGVSHGSPEKVVTSLMKAYGKGNEKLIKECYGQKKEVDAGLQAEINATFSYLKAHGTTKINVEKAETLAQQGDTAYAYVLYDLVLENGQLYPCLTSYLTRKEGRKHFIIPPSEITEEMQSMATLAFEKFMSTKTYKDFSMEYNTFIKKNPGYEDKIAAKLELAGVGA